MTSWLWVIPIPWIVIVIFSAGWIFGEKHWERKRNSKAALDEQISYLMRKCAEHEIAIDELNKEEHKNG